MEPFDTPSERSMRSSDTQERPHRKRVAFLRNVKRVERVLRVATAHLITRNATMNGESQKRPAAISVSHPPCSRTANIEAFYSLAGSECKRLVSTTMR